MNNHPDTETLDHLRAGLLDDRERQAISRHLESCDRCAGSLAGWNRIAEQLRSAETGNIDDRLARARRNAVTQPAASPSIPRVATGIAAMLALAVGIGIWLKPATHNGIDSSRFANAAIPELVEEPEFYQWLAARNEAPDNTIPDVIEDPDFYQWLAGSQQSQRVESDPYA